MRNAFRIALADNEGNDDVVLADTQPIDGETEQVSADIADTARDMDDMHEAVEDAVEETENLEQVVAPLEESVAEGEGVSPEAAQIAEVAVERFRRKFNMPKYRTLPSTESFGSKQSRLQATVAAVEGIWETIKNAWKKIVAFFKKIWEKAKEFCRKIFTAAGRLEARAVALEKQISNAKGLKEDKETWTSESICTAFGKDGKFEDKDVIVILDNTKKTLIEITGVDHKSKESFKKVTSDIKDKIKDVKAFKNNADSVIKILFDYGNVLKLEIKSFEKCSDTTALRDAGVESDNVGATGLLVNNKKIIAYTVTDTIGEQVYYEIKVQILDLSNHNDDTKYSEEEIPVSKLGILSTTCTKVKTLSSELARFSKAQEKSDEVIKLYESLADAIVKFSELVDKKGIEDANSSEKASGEFNTIAKDFSNTRKILSSKVAAMNKIATMIESSTYSCCKLALDFVATNLSCYKS